MVIHSKNRTEKKTRIIEKTNFEKKDLHYLYGYKIIIVDRQKLCDSNNNNYYLGEEIRSRELNIYDDNNNNFIHLSILFSTLCRQG